MIQEIKLNGYQEVTLVTYKNIRKTTWHVSVLKKEELRRNLFRRVMKCLKKMQNLFEIGISCNTLYPLE